MSDHEAEFRLLMPFIVTTDYNGGTFDPSAYAAGWEMAALNARLGAAMHHQLPAPEVTIRRRNLPQAELVAMNHGLVMIERDMPDVDEDTRAEWAYVAFRPGTLP